MTRSMSRGSGLLVIIMFLFTARLSQESIDVPTRRTPEKPRPRIAAATGDVVLEYSADRKITVNKHEVRRSDLAGVLADLYRDRLDKTLWLLGAGTVRYGEIADLIDTAKGAGVGRVGVITPEMRKRR